MLPEYGLFARAWPLTMYAYASEMTMLDDATAVLRFWFDEHAKDWFVKNPAFDAEIRARFLAVHQAAAAGGLARWADAARSCLALVIVLDQFPRNMFRGEARAFATDAAARAAARVILERGWNEAMTESERLFAYLPFEHSESLEDQDLACELMQGFDPEQLRYAERHREIIRRFGRFPHRNGILGRQSTPAEIEFLKLPGSGF
jgi:uncharacterized protein (DUF924 family)